MTRICSVDGCGAKHIAKGLCHKHYKRMQVNGTLDARPIAKMGEPLAFIETLKPADECIIWPFGRDSYGYSRMSLNGKAVHAYRIVCERFHGPCPPDKHHASHLCGNRICVNPTHLRWATRKENAADKIAHGTIVRGEKTRHSKLTREQVLAIRSDSRSQAKIAKAYNVSKGAITGIIYRRNWNWL